MLLTVGKRFLRAFVAGGVSNMAAIVAVTHDVSNLKDLQAWVFTLAVAFVTGGLLALDKLTRYTDAVQ